jgi:hypothetical protein
MMTLQASLHLRTLVASLNVRLLRTGTVRHWYSTTWGCGDMAVLRYIAKAVYAGAATFLGSLIAALQAGSLDLATWLSILLATIVAVGGVFGLANGPAPTAEGRRRHAQRAAADAGGTFVEP